MLLCRGTFPLPNFDNTYLTPKLPAPPEVFLFYNKIGKKYKEAGGKY